MRAGRYGSDEAVASGSISAAAPTPPTISRPALPGEITQEVTDVAARQNAGADTFLEASLSTVRPEPVEGLSFSSAELRRNAAWPR